MLGSEKQCLKIKRILRISLKIFKDHILFGTGTKGFRYLCRNKIYILENNYGCSTHPHNTYIQILASNGVVGFSLLILAFIYTIKELLVSRKKILSSSKFENTIDGLGDGFYVFLEFKSLYQNINLCDEYVLLGQNDKLKWKILRYDFSYESDELDPDKELPNQSN